VEEFVVVELAGYLVGFFAASVMFWHGAVVVIIASALKLGWKWFKQCNAMKYVGQVQISNLLCWRWRNF